MKNKTEDKMTETMEVLKEFCRNKFMQGPLYSINSGVFTTEKDCKESFGLGDNFLAEAFSVQAGRVIALEGKDLRCTIEKDESNPTRFYHTFYDLHTGEILMRDRRVFGRKPFPEKVYEFWVVWLKDPRDSIYERNLFVPIITPPLILD